MRGVLLGLVWASAGCLLEFDDRLLDGGAPPGPDSGVDSGPPPVLDCSCSTAPCDRSCDTEGAAVGDACRCDVACLSAQPCSGTCGGGAECDFVCRDDCAFACDGGTCTVNCDGGSCSMSAGLGAQVTGQCHHDGECTFDCSGGASCDDLECKDTSRCLLICSSGATCSFRNCAGGETQCPGGEIACRTDCP